MPSLAMVYDILAVDRASAVFDKVGGRAVAAGRDIEGASGKISTAMKAVATGAAIGGAAFAVAAVKMASDFNSQMLLIQTQAGASAAEVRKMTPAILSLAGQTAQAPEALATSLYHVESVGLRGAKALDVVSAAAKLATVSHSDLEQTTNALTAAVASNIPGVQNMDQAIGMLNATVGAGDMKMSDLNQAMSSGLLTVVKGYGLSMRDVSASLAVFGDNNIRGANAATMLRMGVQAMAVPVKNGDAILKALGVTTGQTDQALGKYGITGKKLAEDMQSGGLNKAITDLHDHLQAAGVQGNQVGEILTAAFGKKAGPGVAVLLSQFDRLQQKYGAVDAATHSFGAEWDATTKTAKFQMDNLRTSVEGMTISFGNFLMPAVTSGLTWINQTGIPAIKGLGTSIGDAVGWFKSLPGPIQEVALAFGAIKLAMAFGWWQALGDRIVYARVLISEFADSARGSIGKVSAAFNEAKAASTFVQTIDGGAANRFTGSIRGIGAAASEAAKGGLSMLKSAGSGLVGFLGGPWGVAIAAATVALPAFINLFKTAPTFVDRVKDSMKSLTQAIQASNGAIDESVRRTAALSLQHAGLFEASSRWEVSTGTLTNAILGNKDAMAQVKAAADAYSTALQGMAKEGGLNAVAAADATKKSNDWLTAINKLAATTSGQVADANAITAAVQGSTAATNASTVASDALKSAVSSAGVTMRGVWDANTADVTGATDTQIAALEALGQKAIHLPGGRVIVTSDTGQARTQLDQLIRDYSNRQLTIAGGNFGPAAARLTPAQNAGGTGYAEGGWTGPGSKYTPAGVVHADEFVVPKHRVNALGGPNAVGSLVGMPGYASGGSVAPFNMYDHMSSAVSAATMQQIAAAIAKMAPAVGTPGGAPSSVSGNAAIVQRVASQYGWGGGPEWNALYNVIMRESGFRNTAQNPTSTAYGMFQFLDSTWAGYGVSKTSDPLFQSVAGMRYLKGRYGDPLGAYRHEQQFGWYKNGTNFVPQDGPAYLHKGEAVVPASKNQGAPYQSGDVNVRVFIGNQEIRDITRVEIDRAHGQMALTAAAGSSSPIR